MAPTALALAVPAPTPAAPAPQSPAGTAVETAPDAPRPQVQGLAAPDPAPAPPAPRVTLVTVQPGHTLWRLSREHYGEGTRYIRIYSANRAQIRNPDLIYPGQIFAIPD
jgi:nucleoid-associated protein YgaU